VTLYDLLAADAKWHVTYDLDRPDLATFTTLGDAVATYRAQAASAAQRANVPAQLAALANLAAVQQAGGDGAGASATLADALELARSADARDAEARFALQLAGVRGDGNDYAAALEAARRALVLSRAIGDPEGIARASSAINRLRLGTPPP
jgi:tetratricopeptide (TPR) repeat protein